MTGGEVLRRLRQHLKIQAFGFLQAPAALQRDGLVRQGFSIHVSRIRRPWYPFANCEKQVAKARSGKAWGRQCKAAIAVMPWP
jgi:hypothetical protein